MSDIIENRVEIDIKNIDDADKLIRWKAEFKKLIAEIDERLKDLAVENWDSRLEDIVTLLQANCDGASSEDGAGYNKADAEYGHWLADVINSGGHLSPQHAQKALKMVAKYHRQYDISLPEWEEIEKQYVDHYDEKVGEPLDFNLADSSTHSIRVFGNEVYVKTPYDPSGEFQRQAKTITSYRWDGPSKSWIYPLTQLDAVINTLATDEYVIDTETRGLAAMIKSELDTARIETEAKRLEAEAVELKRIEEEERAEEIRQATAEAEYEKLITVATLSEPIPAGKTLFHHQKEGVAWLLSHREGSKLKGGILADDMGLGKTIQALKAAKAMKDFIEDLAVFVISPASLIKNWQRESVEVGVETEVFSWGKVPAPIDVRPYVVIGDEIHFCQNIKASRSKKFIALSQHEKCLAVWGLTGTPMKNAKPENLFPLLVATGHPLGKDQKEYNKTYCYGYRGGAGHLDDLSKKIEDVMLRRTKRECLDLPEKIRMHRPAELTPDEQRHYKTSVSELVEDYRRRVDLGEVDAMAEALVTINYMRKVGSLIKVRSVIEMAEEIMEQDEQVVIFTDFVDSAEILHEKLGGELLTGNTPQKDRQDLVDRFQSGDSKVFVSTIKAGGVGITLTKASYVILADRPWTPGDAVQAEDRCHRIGQNETVHAYWVQAGDIDLWIDELLEKKQERIDLIYKGKRKTLRGLNSPKQIAKQLIDLL